MITGGGRLRSSTSFPFRRLRELTHADIQNSVAGMIATQNKERLLVLSK